MARLFDSWQWRAFDGQLKRLRGLKEPLVGTKADYLGHAERYAVLCVHLQHRTYGSDGDPWSLWSRWFTNTNRRMLKANLKDFAAVLKTIETRPFSEALLTGIVRTFVKYNHMDALLMTTPVMDFCRLAWDEATLEKLKPHEATFNAHVHQLLLICVGVDNKPKGCETDFSIWHSEFKAQTKAGAVFVFELAAAQLAHSLKEPRSDSNTHKILDDVASAVVNLSDFVQTARTRFLSNELGKVFIRAAALGIDGGLGGVLNELATLNPRPGEEFTPWNTTFESEHRVQVLVALAQAAQQLNQILNAPGSGAVQLEHQTVSRAQQNQNIAHTLSSIEIAVFDLK